MSCDSVCVSCGGGAVACRPNACRPKALLALFVGRKSVPRPSPDPGPGFLSLARELHSQGRVLEFRGRSMFGVIQLLKKHVSVVLNVPWGDHEPLRAPLRIPGASPMVIFTATGAPAIDVVGG